MPGLRPLSGGRILLQRAANDLGLHVRRQGLLGEAFWHWCEANGYRHVPDQHSYRNLIFGLLSDLCHFLYEGLKCSEMAKLSVAFANFRKPLQDNFFYLEWIQCGKCELTLALCEASHAADEKPARDDTGEGQ